MNQVWAGHLKVRCTQQGFHEETKSTILNSEEKKERGRLISHRRIRRRGTGFLYYHTPLSCTHAPERLSLSKNKKKRK
jgi:hypothetical protein